MNLLYITLIPIAAGLICLMLPRKVKYAHEALTIAVSGAVFLNTIFLFYRKPFQYFYKDILIFSLDSLSAFIIMGTAFFALLISVYSAAFMAESSKRPVYYCSFLMTLGAASGAVLANHLVVLMVFWGFLGFLLYSMILTGGDRAGPAARKSLVLIGGTDVLMLLGIAVIYRITGLMSMHTIYIPISTFASYAAFVLLAAGVFAKAGAMPLHTWVPDAASFSPAPAAALLPASLDKLIGIYLLIRLVRDMFQVNMAVKIALMALGSVTIVAAVFMALIQHDMKRLLGYHAVSQVGYMILGIGTGTTLGIIGGLFHMVNNTVYKSCLFLAGGCVEKETGTTDLDSMGGLARKMPLTYISFLIAALAISGIPPLNGFASKWLVYQGLIDLGEHQGTLWLVWLAAALFGSGLTLASFMKLIHAVFLGIPHKNITKKRIHDPGFLMMSPVAILAIVCVVFGIFAFYIPLRLFILPIAGKVSYIGFWSPGMAMLATLAGLAAGLLIYLFSSMKVRQAAPFIGGEKLPDKNRVTGTGFYKTIRMLPGLRKLFDMAEALCFDLYKQCMVLLEKTARYLRAAHTGILNMYMLWLCLGIAALVFVFMGGL